MILVYLGVCELVVYFSEIIQQFIKNGWVFDIVMLVGYMLLIGME